MTTNIDNLPKPDSVAGDLELLRIYLDMLEAGERYVGDAIVPLGITVDVERILVRLRRRLVVRARVQRFPWAAIGDALQVSRQAAFNHYGADAPRVFASRGGKSASQVNTPGAQNSAPGSIVAPMTDPTPGAQA